LFIHNISFCFSPCLIARLLNEYVYIASSKKNNQIYFNQNESFFDFSKLVDLAKIFSDIIKFKKSIGKYKFIGLFLQSLRCVVRALKEFLIVEA